MTWNNRPPLQYIRPTLRRDPKATHNWQCHDRYRVYGMGPDPMAAYVDWVVKQARRTRLARHTRWNKRSCHEWAQAGCPEIGSFYAFADGMRQVVGYDWATDEIILRG